MKIEICEQMMQSWLLNCKLCEIAQTNWKISPLYIKTISSALINNVQTFMNDIKANIPEGANIFGNNNAEQFIRQCEIDIVGIKLDNGNVDHVYLVDSAFHKDGLGYKNPTSKVVMKIARAAAVSQIVFGKTVSTKIVFASPKCNPAPRNSINAAIKSVMPIVNKYYPNVTVEIYFNDDFSTMIYQPLVQNINELYDDNDLFMRSLNLAKVSEKNLPKNYTLTVTNTGHSAVKSPRKTINATNTSSKTPRIVLKPSDPTLFTSELLKKKRAEITWIYNDGTQEDKTWNAQKFTKNSDLYNNIKTREQWKNKTSNGLIEVRIKIV